jgi:hypothetical protein
VVTLGEIMRWITVAALLLMLMAFGVAGAITWESELEHSSWGGYLKADDIHGRVHLGLADATAYKMIDSGAWTVHTAPWPFNASIIVTPHRALEQRLLTGVYGNTWDSAIFLSEDLGATDSFVHAFSQASITEIMADPIDSDRLYACLAYSAIFRSLDGGLSWDHIHGESQQYFYDMTAGPEGRIYAGGFKYDGYETIFAGLKRSDDGGENWVEASNGLPDEKCRVLAADPHLAGHLYAGTEGGLFESFNAGELWSSILDQDIHAIAMHPQEPEVLAVLRDFDILLSVNGGSSWTDISGNLSGGATYDDLCISAADNRLYLATYNHVYSTSLDLTAVAPAPTPALALSAHPNPFNPSSTLEVTLPFAGLARLSIHDSMGREVALISNHELPMGSTRFTWQAEDLPSGVYLARLEVSGAVSSHRLILLK